MREIKFRAWHPEEKKMWIDVGTDGCGGVILDTEYMGLKPLKGESILMQYTGLKDKAGKEIYEGDNLKSMRWFPLSRPPLREQREIDGYVCWDDRSFGWELKTKEDEFCLFELIEPVVIGNIYKNPEVVSG